MNMYNVDSVEGLLSLLQGLVQGSGLAGSPSDITPEDYAKGKRFVQQMLDAPTIEDMKKVYGYAKHWHDDPDVRESDYRHLYTHGVLELAPLLSFVKFGPDLQG